MPHPAVTRRRDAARVPVALGLPPEHPTLPSLLKDAGYLTDLISRRAVGWLDAVAGGDAPFFLSVHDTAPHWPWETRDDAALAADVKDNLFRPHGGNIHWEAWNATLPPVPDDATVSLGYGAMDMPQR